MVGPFDSNPDVWITSFWGWSPSSWGCVGFTNPARPHNIAKITSDPFIMLVYVAKTSPGNSPYKGKVTGYYELSHEIGDKSQYIAPHQLTAPHHPKKAWLHSFRALRSWTIEDRYMPTINDFYPEVISKKRYRAISTWGQILPEEQIEKLKSLPANYKQVYSKESSDG